MPIIVPFRTAMLLPHLLKDNISIKINIYGHETSSVTLKGRYKFLTFLNKILGTIFGPKWMK
jgi:hypothetical protein